MDEKNVDGVVVCDLVFEDFDVFDSHDVNASASGEIVDGAETFGSEVGGVVVHDLIVVDADVFSALAGKIG